MRRAMRLPAYFALFLASLATACGPAVATGASAGSAPASSAIVTAAADSAGGVSVPPVVGEWRLVDAEAVRGDGAGGLYRFSDGSSARVSVIVYPVPDDVLVESTPEARVEREGRKFQEVLELLARRGTYDGVMMAYADPDSVVANGAPVPGYSAAAAALRGGQVTIELQNLYIIGSRFVKIRATLPERGWQDSTVPRFAKELARAVAGH
jgi:hypothetical protein